MKVNIEKQFDEKYDNYIIHICTYTVDSIRKRFAYKNG